MIQNVSQKWQSDPDGRNKIVLNRILSSQVSCSRSIFEREMRKKVRQRQRQKDREKNKKKEEKKERKMLTCTPGSADVTSVPDIPSAGGSEIGGRHSGVGGVGVSVPHSHLLFSLPQWVGGHSVHVSTGHVTWEGTCEVCLWFRFYGRWADCRIAKKKRRRRRRIC